MLTYTGTTTRWFNKHWFLLFHRQLNSLKCESANYCSNSECFRCLLKKTRLLSVEISTHLSDYDDWSENIYANDDTGIDLAYPRQFYNTYLNLNAGYGSSPHRSNQNLNMFYLQFFKSIVHYGDNIGAKSVKCVITENNYESQTLINQEYEIYQVNKNINFSLK